MAKNKKQKYFEHHEDLICLTNDRTFFDYYIRLKALAMSMFEWNNLPVDNGKAVGVDPRFMEKILFEFGYCVYFHDDTLGDLVLPCTITGDLNPYNIPKQRTAYTTTGMQWDLTDENSVLIYNNYEHYPTAATIQLFAMRLSQIERSIDVNLQNQQTPFAWLCEESEVQTIKTAYRRKTQNNPLLILEKKNKAFENGIEKVDLTVPYNSDKLYDMKQKLLNEVYEFLGITTSKYEKAERVIESEVLSNNGIAMAQRYVMLNSRRDAVERINRMFNRNITVDYRQQLETFNVNNFSTTQNPPLNNSEVKQWENIALS